VHTLRYILSVKLNHLHYANDTSLQNITRVIRFHYRGITAILVPILAMLEPLEPLDDLYLTAFRTIRCSLTL